MGPSVTRGGGHWVTGDRSVSLCDTAAPGAGAQGWHARLGAGPAHHPPTNPHLSMRMASVLRSFSSQVSLSSAMIFSVSCGARESSMRRVLRPGCQARGGETPIPGSVQAALCLKDQGHGLRSDMFTGPMSFLWTHLEKEGQDKRNLEGEKEIQVDNRCWF